MNGVFEGDGSLTIGGEGTVSVADAGFFGYSGATRLKSGKLYLSDTEKACKAFGSSGKKIILDGGTMQFAYKNEDYQTLSFPVEVEDESGHLPKAVESLFEKKKLELLYNLHYIDSVTSKNSKFEIVLTKEYSDNIDGVKLFEYCTDLSKDIKISYKYGKLMLSVPSLKEAIDKILQLVDNLDKLEKK